MVTGYEHVPTVADLRSIQTHLATVVARDEDHDRELMEDIELLRVEIEKRETH